MFKGFPDSLRIGAATVKVEICDEVNRGKDWGEWDEKYNVIRLDKNHNCSGHFLDTTIHEVLHAIWCLASMKHIDLKEDAEERIVCVFGSWLAMVFIDNPLLVKWIASATK